jgi:hypothetical protein
MIMYVLELEVDGRPRTKGSHVVQRGRNGKLRAAAVQEDDLKVWTSAIRNAVSLERSAAQRASTWPRELPIGPVLVLARFRLTLPRRLADDLDPEPATVVPDGDKLERALWDALTGLAWADDRQVVGWAGLKVYASPLEVPGVTAKVLALEPYEAGIPGHVPALLAQLVADW